MLEVGRGGPAACCICSVCSWSVINPSWGPLASTERESWHENWQSWQQTWEMELYEQSPISQTLHHTITFTEHKLKHCTALHCIYDKLARQDRPEDHCWDHYGIIILEIYKYLSIWFYVRHSLKALFDSFKIIYACWLPQRPPRLIMLFWSFLFKTRVEEFHIKPDPGSGLKIGVIWFVIKSSKLHSR